MEMRYFQENLGNWVEYLFTYLHYQHAVAHVHHCTIKSTETKLVERVKVVTEKCCNLKNILT